MKQTAIIQNEYSGTMDQVNACVELQILELSYHAYGYVYSSKMFEDIEVTF